MAELTLQSNKVTGKGGCTRNHILKPWERYSLELRSWGAFYRNPRVTRATRPEEGCLVSPAASVATCALLPSSEAGAAAVPLSHVTMDASTVTRTKRDGQVQTRPAALRFLARQCRFHPPSSVATSSELMLHLAHDREQPEDRALTSGPRWRPGPTPGQAAPRQLAHFHTEAEHRGGQSREVGPRAWTMPRASHPAAHLCPLCLI